MKIIYIALFTYLYSPIKNVHKIWKLYILPYSHIYILLLKMFIKYENYIYCLIHIFIFSY